MLICPILISNRHFESQFFLDHIITHVKGKKENLLEYSEIL
jgi:hypothetical protein